MTQRDTRREPSRKDGPAGNPAAAHGTDAVVEPGQTKSDEGRNQGTDLWARITASAIVVFYLGMYAFMLSKRSDPGWDHMTFLFNSLESLVLVAAGVLLGTRIQHATVQRADQEVRTARDDADKARKRARAAERGAEGGEAMAKIARRGGKLSSAERTDEYRDDRQSGTSGRRSNRHEPSAEDVQGALLALADQYFPEDSEA